MKQSNKLIIGIIAALAIIIGILVVYNLQQVEDKKDSLTICINGVETTAFTQDAIAGLEQTQDLVLSQARNSQPSLERNVTVITVKDLLNQAGVDTSAITELSVTALDGFETTYTAEEIQSDDTVYLIIQEDGEFLSGEHGKFAMAVPSDSDSKRWSRQVYMINVTLS